MWSNIARFPAQATCVTAIDICRILDTLVFWKITRYQLFQLVRIESRLPTLTTTASLCLTSLCSIRAVSR